MVTDPQVRELMKLIQSEETLALAAAVSTGFFPTESSVVKAEIGSPFGVFNESALLYSSKASCSSSWVFMTMGKAFSSWRRKEQPFFWDRRCDQTPRQ
jgi:hypothetical protein